MEWVVSRRSHLQVARLDRGSPNRSHGEPPGHHRLPCHDLVRDHGVEHLFGVAILTGVVQFGLGALGVGRLMRFVPRTVMSGFVDALAILIFLAQLEHVVGERALVWAMFGLALAGIYLLPRLTQAVRRR